MIRLPRASHEPKCILVAEDNKYDRLILQTAFDELSVNIRLFFVPNGEEVLDYLHATNAHAPAGAAPRPDLILMDLNMPRMNGNETVVSIRADTNLRLLPIIAFSTSDSPTQIAQAYASGVNAFVTKPGRFDDFVDTLRKFSQFWLEAAQLPGIAACGT